MTYNKANLANMNDFDNNKNNNPFPAMEEAVLNFWDKAEIFRKSVENPPAGGAPRGNYVFYDGPPFATGTPHYGHIVASVMKDVMPRYWTMKGYRVERKWGWDCHGLPIENIVEKEMGFKNKKDIEKMGVAEFNEKCRSKVLGYVEDWEKIIRRLGRWADMKNAYKTMDLDFMESVWWVFKELYNKGLIYQGYRSMHICPRCETTLSQQEIAEGYKMVKDLSATVKFEIANPSELDANLTNGEKVYVLAWTTTPWTLIGNVALAVGEKIDYVFAKAHTGEYYIIALKQARKLANRFPQVLRNFKSKDLVGKKYKPLFNYYANDENLKNRENGWKIYAADADFVNTDEGTGVVHIAPAFGENDMNLGKEHNLPFIQHVNMDGTIKSEAKEFAGLNVKPIDDTQKTDVEIIKYLAKNKLLFAKEKYEHSYPHCWRCETPLINYATTSWFVAVTKVKDRALELAQKVNWFPAHIKEGRFGNWLAGARDWSISRQRFWASVMPIWQCACGETKVFGSAAELEKASGEKITDLHKHIIDKIIFPCEKCSGAMKRIPDVLDTWFDSGSMPYAQAHYPFADKEKFAANFPAEFIAEGVDQTRAWFYYLHIIATAIKDSQAFNNVIVNGIVLAEDGKKMSKRLNNYPDPAVIFDKYGADAMRYYLCASPVMKADNINFSEKDLAEQTRFLNILLNVLSFYKIFASGVEVSNLEDKDLINVLDKWITSRLEETKQVITEKMDNYNLQAIREIPLFINDLSTWYVRRSRDRFKGDDPIDKIRALKTLRHTLYHLARIIAPFMPFMAEHIYQELGAEAESVHLEQWPEVREEWIDEKVLTEMITTRKLIEFGLAKRDKAGIKVRQIISESKMSDFGLPEENLRLIKDELNIKKVSISPSISPSPSPSSDDINLYTEMTPELELEGLKREIVRQVNSLRKQAGLTIKDKIILSWQSDSEMIKNVFVNLADELKRDTLSEKIVEKEIESEEVKVNEEMIKLEIKKI
ncbi:MAG: isoleucine--tRNA ligase [Parcubacteria group bacterium]|nr:isoleucine--tRNA ligase [Parcubacteria group bacterium]